MEVNRHMDTGSRLTVRAYHVEDVSYGGENRITVDGAVFSCNGLGNNHVDYAHSIEAAEKRGIPVVALSLCPAEDFVVQNQYMDGVFCYYKTLDEGRQAGDETTVLAQNTVMGTDARKALAMLKLKMRKKEKEG